MTLMLRLAVVSQQNNAPHPVSPPLPFWPQQKAVQDLYDFRDHFFEKNSLDRAIHKTQELGQELKKVIELLDESQSKLPQY